MNHILLVEDDERLASLVKNYLESNDFTVDIEGNGDNVEFCLERSKPDLVILDILLPGKDGLTICREIRPSYQGPILMLTARDSDMDQVLGLEFGADDYVIKPAEPRVLLARIRALLRRSQAQSETDIDEWCFGSLKIKASTRSVSLNQKSIILSTHEFDLLVELAKHAGQILSREYLFSRIYNRPYDGLDRSIDVRISHLRKKLGDCAENPERIKTIWGKGYLFISEAW